MSKIKKRENSAGYPRIEYDKPVIAEGEKPSEIPYPTKMKVRRKGSSVNLY